MARRYAPAAAPQKEDAVEIMLGSSYRLRSQDAFNLVLEQLCDCEAKEDGKARQAGEKYQEWRAVPSGAYFGSLDHALAAYAQHRIRASEARTLEQLRQDMAGIREEIAGVRKALEP